MTMKDMHGLECSQCKIRDEFYETFNSDSKKNVSYFGVISYINNYYVMPVSSDKTKKNSNNGRNHVNSNIFLQLINEWTVRDLIAKQIEQKEGLITNRLYSRHFRKKNTGPRPSFYLPEHTGNLITIKKSESFTVSPPDDTVCSDSLEATKDVYKCKLTKKSPKRKDGGCPGKVSYTKKVSRIKQDPAEKAPKEPKVGTLKRKRWNWEKLKSKESYEDDLFEEKKFKRITVEDSNNSEEDKISTPRWSVQISPRELSRSPSYEDCYSPTELRNSRKEAEEYQHRRNKWQKGESSCKKDDPETVMKEDLITYNTLTKVSSKLDKVKKLNDKLEKEREKDSEPEDHYFSDLEDSSN